VINTHYNLHTYIQHYETSERRSKFLNKTSLIFRGIGRIHLGLTLHRQQQNIYIFVIKLEICLLWQPAKSFFESCSLQCCVSRIDLFFIPLGTEDVVTKELTHFHILLRSQRLDFTSYNDELTMRIFDLSHYKRKHLWKELNRK
jgi:hypothetical protein